MPKFSDPRALASLSSQEGAWPRESVHVCVWWVGNCSEALHPALCVSAWTAWRVIWDRQWPSQSENSAPRSLPLPLLHCVPGPFPSSSLLSCLSFFPTFGRFLWLLPSHLFFGHHFWFPRVLSVVFLYHDVLIPWECQHFKCTLSKDTFKKY